MLDCLSRRHASAWTTAIARESTRLTEGAQEESPRRAHEQQEPAIYDPNRTGDFTRPIRLPSARGRPKGWPGHRCRCIAVNPHPHRRRRGGAPLPCGKGSDCAGPVPELRSRSTYRPLLANTCAYSPFGPFPCSTCRHLVDPACAVPLRCVGLRFPPESLRHLRGARTDPSARAQYQLTWSSMSRVLASLRQPLHSGTETPLAPLIPGSRVTAPDGRQP